MNLLITLIVVFGAYPIWAVEPARESCALAMQAIKEDRVPRTEDVTDQIVEELGTRADTVKLVDREIHKILVQASLARQLADLEKKTEIESIRDQALGLVFLIEELAKPDEQFVRPSPKMLSRWLINRAYEIAKEDTFFLRDLQTMLGDLKNAIQSDSAVYAREKISAARLNELVCDASERIEKRRLRIETWRLELGAEIPRDDLYRMDYSQLLRDQRHPLYPLNLEYTF